MKITKLRKQRLRSKIQEARAELMVTYPYFGMLLMYLKYVAIDNIRNISTNGRCIYFHPDFLEKLTLYETQFILCHQIMHIVSGDIWREETYIGDDYHRAYDIRANRQLMKLGWRESCLTHMGKLQYDIPKCGYEMDALSVFEIYDVFPFKLYMLDERTRNRYMADTDFWWDYKENEGQEGIIILDIPKMTVYSEEPEFESKSSKQKSMGIQEFWETKSRQAMQTTECCMKGKAAGNVPESIRRAIEEKEKPILDWRKMLDEFVQEEITDYSFLPPDRRFSDYDFFLPDFNEKEFLAKDILFMADTSGSIAREDLEIVFAEMRGAVEQFNGKINGKLGFFDAEVTAPIPFSGINELNKIIPYGGGGTDFTVIFDYVKNEMNHCLPSAIVIFTDGYGPFPQQEAAMNIPVLWLINNKCVVPPFGKVGRILSKRIEGTIL